MNADRSTPQFAAFLAMAAAHLAEDGNYGPVPPPTSLQQSSQSFAIFGRTRQAGMAVNVDLVALCAVDGWTPVDLANRLDALATLVRTIGEQGNVDARRGGQGRQVSALMLWVYVHPVATSVAEAAVALQRDVRGSSFGRWPVQCAAVALADSRVYEPSSVLRPRRTRLAGDLLRAWQTSTSGGPGGTAAVAPDKDRRNDLARALTAGQAPATYGLLVLIGLFFAAMQLSGGATSSRVLLRFGALVTSLVLAGQWWRLVSAAFLHIGWAHLLFDGWALYVYGPLVERLYGPTRFLAIYLLAAIAGDALSLPLIGGISAGASGAIFGLFGATISLVLRHRRVLPATVRDPLLRNAVAVVAVNAVLSVAVAGINLYAHAGGFVAGLLLGALLQPRPLVTGRRQSLLGATVGVVIALLGVVALLLTVANLLTPGLTLP